MINSLPRKSALLLFAAAAILCANISAAQSTDKAPGPQNALGITADFGKWTQQGTGEHIDWVYNSTDAPAGWLDDATTAAAFQAALDEWSG
ncbi:MAG: hypothetical protein KJO82_12275, partial [Gammaproteobacteria bacterium]|nr:hypothetical protein [Gammaproteobacteria bacterium]